MTEPAGDAGYRDEITEDEAAQLPATDPNIAAADHDGDGPENHEAYLGAFVDDDEAGAILDAETATRENDLDGDGVPDDQAGAR